VERFLQITQAHPQIHWEICPSLDNKNDAILEIRDGLNLQLFEANLDLLLQGKVKICFGPTASCLSILDFPEFLLWMLNKTKAYGLVFGSDWSIASNTVTAPVEMHPGLLPLSYTRHVERAIAVVRENYPAGENAEKFISYLQNLKELIGSQRSPETLAQARQWYTQQGKYKKKDYFSLFPILGEILNG